MTKQDKIDELMVAVKFSVAQLRYVWYGSPAGPKRIKLVMDRLEAAIRRVDKSDL